MVRRLSRTLVLLFSLLLVSGQSAMAEQAILREYGWLEDTDNVISSDESEQDSETDTEAAEKPRVYDVYTFVGRYGQTVRITAQSIAFDTYLVLVSEETKLVDKNDDMEEDGFTTNAQITTTLPLDGEYRVVVMSFGEEARGSYVLSVTDVSEPSSDRGTVSIEDDWAQSGGECAIVRCFE